jgi:hypothetical protein
MRLLGLTAAAALLALAPVGGAPSAPSVREDNSAPQDWYHIIKIDARTFALSEPKYWQRNVSYLILGSKQALLSDTGPGIYSIRDLVQRLTSLPVIVVPSHLHFDHVGRISEFTDMALLDKRELRSLVKDGVFTETQCVLGEFPPSATTSGRFRSYFAAQLAHEKVDQVAKIYNRAVYVPERRAMMELVYVHRGVNNRCKPRQRRLTRTKHLVSL